MKLKERFVRIAVALSLASLIGSQLPMTGVTAFAQDSRQCGPPGVNGVPFLDNDDDSDVFGLSGKDFTIGFLAVLGAVGLYTFFTGNDGDGDGRTTTTVIGAGSLASAAK